jgi:hypothetical protein
MGGRFLAGAARAVIEMPLDAFPLDGFVGVRDELCVRALLLESDGFRIAVVSLELVSIPEDLLADLREEVRRVAGVEPGDALIAVTHTFSAPHVFAPDAVSAEESAGNQRARKAVIDALTRALSSAVADPREARVSHGAGQATVNINRETPTAEGWWFGANESGPVDRGVGVLRVDDLAGEPIAFLLNYAAQSSIMHESATATGAALITGDLAGATSRYVEAAYAESAPVALFLIAAAGDQGPLFVANRHVTDRHGRSRRVDIGADGFRLIELLGERLGAEAVRVSESLVPSGETPRLATANVDVTLPGQMAPRNFRDLVPTRDYEFVPDGDVTAPAILMRIGELVILGVQVELCCETGLWIKNNAPFDHVFVATVVNGGAKYMAPSDGYDRRTYSAMNSKYARGAAEQFARRLVDELAELSSQTTADREGEHS